MKSWWAVIVGVPLLASFATAGEPEALKTEKEKSSYAIGVDVGRNLRNQEVDVDLDLLIRGMRDARAGGKLLMTDQELLDARKATQNEVMRRQAAKKQQMSKAKKMSAEENRKAGEAFLAENRAKEGVVVLPSGLQYKVLKAGDGKKPTESGAVEVHYRGTLLDGSQFGSSGQAGKPSSFRVAELIPGMREALLLMPAGSRWQLVVPPGLGYGDRGKGQIGPNATLIFEVELVAVK